MIDLLISFGAIAEGKTRFGPDHSYQLPASADAPAAQPEPPVIRPWAMPKLGFDDAQDCLTFLERQIDGFGILRITHRCPEGTGEPAPWRSL